MNAHGSMRVPAPRDCAGPSYDVWGGAGEPTICVDLCGDAGSDERNLRCDGKPVRSLPLKDVKLV
jgi:hypothetical protein